MKETECEIDGEGYKGMRKTVTERWRELHIGLRNEHFDQKERWKFDDYREINREGAVRDKNDTDENSTKSFNLKNNDMSHHIFL